MVSLATEFGPYLCSDNYILGILRGVPFIGVFIGLMFSTFYSDNKSRRTAVILLIVLVDIGFVILVLSVNMPMAIIGMFILHLGATPLMRTAQALLSEITEPNLRQKFVSSLVGGLAIGALIAGVVYPAIGHWRYSSLYIGLLPAICLTIFILIVL